MNDEVTVIDFFHARSGVPLKETLNAIFNDLKSTSIDTDDYLVTMYDGIDVIVHSHTDGPEKGDVTLSTQVGGAVWPWNASDDETYQARMSSVLEMICRLANHLNPDYVVLYETNTHGMSVIPKNWAVENGIDQAPVIGIYSDTVIEQWGKIEKLYETTPYYTAELPGGQTLVVESADPWQRRGWSPPTDAEYIASASFHESSDAKRDDDRPLGLSDPFAALPDGEYGTDVCICPEDADAEFANDTLHLVPVRVDSAGNLRRRSDDTFVRNVVPEASDDRRETIAAMLSEVPPDAASDDQMVSALLHEAIPPKFVRSDDPDGETVVSKVMALDVETNKIDLLTALGSAVQGSERNDAEALSIVDEALETLSTIEELDGDVDGWIQQHVL